MVNEFDFSNVPLFMFKKNNAHYFDILKQNHTFVH